jgi:hypothetical protein
MFRQLTTLSRPWSERATRASPTVDDQPATRVIVLLIRIALFALVWVRPGIHLANP